MNESLSIVIPTERSLKVNIPMFMDIAVSRSQSSTQVRSSPSESLSQIDEEMQKDDDKKYYSTPNNLQTILISRRIDGLDQLVPKRFFDGWCGKRSLYQRTWNIFYNTIASALHEKLKKYPVLSADLNLMRKYPVLSAELTLVSFAAIKCDIFTKYEQGSPLLLGDSTAMKKRIEEETTPEFIVTLRRVIEYIHKIAALPTEKVEAENDEKVSPLEIDKMVQNRRKNSLSVSFQTKVLIDMPQSDIKLISKGFRNIYKNKREFCTFEEIMACKGIERLSFQNIHKIFLIIQAVFERAKTKRDENKSWDDCLDEALQEWPSTEKDAEKKKKSAFNFVGDALNAWFGTSSV